LEGHHLHHWIDGGESTPENLALLCAYHHRLLHEGGVRVAGEDAETLRFVTADGRTIPRHGYRREDFVDESDANGEPSAEGLCTARVQGDFERAEVRETRAIYRIRRPAAVDAGRLTA
jgi:hypothetical protein